MYRFEALFALLRLNCPPHMLIEIIDVVVHRLVSEIPVDG